MEAKKDKEIYDSHGVRAVRRAVQILCRLANDGESSITKLAHDTGLHKSTVYRLLTTLEQDAMVRQDPITGQYKLGWKVMELGASVIRGVELRTSAHPHLERLAKKTNATVHLAILDQGSVLYIDKIEVEGSFKLYSQIGRRAPLHCTALR